MFGDSYNCELVLEKVVEQEWCENIPPPRTLTSPSLFGDVGVKLESEMCGAEKAMNRSSHRHRIVLPDSLCQISHPAM